MRLRNLGIKKAKMLRLRKGKIIKVGNKKKAVRGRKMEVWREIKRCLGKIKK